MRNFSLALKTNSAYARLPLNGRTLADITRLNEEARERRALGIDTRPRLRRRAEPLGLPSGPEQLAAQTLDPTRVSQWLRA